MKSRISRAAQYYLARQLKDTANKWGKKKRNIVLMLSVCRVFASGIWTMHGLRPHNTIDRFAIVFAHFQDERFLR